MHLFIHFTILIYFFSSSFQGVHDLLSDDLSNNLIDHNVKSCIVCSPDSLSSEDEVYLFAVVVVFTKFRCFFILSEI